MMLAMAVLTAQFGGQLHGYSHLHADAPQGQHWESQGGKLCFECLSYAPLLTTAGAPAQLDVGRPQGVIAAPDASVTSLISQSFTPGFRSRAPPALS